MNVVEKEPLFGRGIVDYSKLGYHTLFTHASVVKCGEVVAFNSYR